MTPPVSTLSSPDMDARPGAPEVTALREFLAFKLGAEE